MVTISGNTFADVTAVKFNGAAATTFNVASPTSITATVPSSATTGKISLTWPAGTATSTSSFTVTPTITRLVPAYGPVGTSVSITGTTFSGATSVQFNGTAASFTIVSSTNITATVPAGATSGPITVLTPNGTATSSSSFNVGPVPTITSFTPTSGPVGTSVSITGTAFTGATAVAFHGTSATTFNVVSPTNITAVVPAGATTGTISVTTPVTTATSSASFTVIPTPTITSFSPTSGPIGTSVTISGTNFSGVTAVAFNGVAATTFTMVGYFIITATVPVGATTGTISVTTPGGTATSSNSFTVIPAPTISSFTPTSGPVGTSVTISGTAFTNASAVTFNGVAATTFAVVNSTTITATVPAGATTGAISITTPGGTGTSSGSFTVTATVLTVSGLTISPGSVQAGQSTTGTVTLSGNTPTGATVNLSSDNAGVAAPASGTVIVAAGNNFATFQINSIAAGSANIMATLGASSLSDPVSVTPASSAGGVGYRIDAGSSTSFTDSLGSIWSAETGTFSGGTATTFTASVAGVPTADIPLYQPQRTGTSFTYTLTAPDGNYLLVLLFAELDPTVIAAGQRVCTVSSVGQTLLTFDTFASVGSGVGATQVVPVTIAGGSITLTFTGVGTNGTAAVAGIQLGLLPSGGGVTPFIPGQSTPVPFTPAPDWGEESIPMDGSSDAEGAGPSMAGPVNLSAGVEENSPGADLWCYNPTGPSVSYARLYLTQRPNSGLGYASPGLSPGWTDNYDMFVTPGVGNYTLHYNNDGMDLWTGTTGTLSNATVGTPYLMSQTAAVGTTPAFITMTSKDRSKTTFTQIAAAGGNYATGTYLISSMTNLVGHSITINRDTAANGYRVLSVTNDSGTALLSFTYTGTQLATVTDKDGRAITYTFSGGNLYQVSQINTPASVRWQYGYIPLPGNPTVPALSTVQAPDPSSPGNLSPASTSAYYGVTGAVASHGDALGNTRSYTYSPATGGGLVQLSSVMVSNAGGGLVQQWKHKIGAGNVEIGTVDAANNVDSAQYYGPYLPNAATNEIAQTSTATYDSFGNVITVVSPRGDQVTTTFAYPADFPLGQATQVQLAHVNSSHVIDNSLTPTQITYYGVADGEFNGLVKQTLSPMPDTVNGSSPAVPSTFVYDPTLVNGLPLGNISQVTTVGPNSVIGTPSTYSTITYSYTNGTVTTPSLNEPLSLTSTGQAPSGVSGTQTTETTSYTYDSRGNVLTYTDAQGNVTSTTYNIADQPISVIYPHTGSGSGQAHTDTIYQYPGGPASSVIVYDENNVAVREVDTAYNAEGEVKSVTGSTQPVSYAYDARGRVVQQTDANNNSTFFNYDSVGNLYEELYPLHGLTFDVKTYNYDPAHNLTSEVDGRGVTTTYTRTDPESLVTGIAYSTLPASVTAIAPVSFTYDLYGRRTSMVDGTGTTTYNSYDDLNNLLSMTKSFIGGPQNQTIAYAHNVDGSRASLTWPTNVTNGVGGVNLGNTNYTYDALGRLVQTQFPWNYGLWQHQYLSNGLISATSETLDPGGVYPLAAASYAYNARGFLTNLSNYTAYMDPANGTTRQTGPSYSMTYDALGNKTLETASIPAIGYQYFVAGNPVPLNASITQDASHTITYGYDTSHAAPSNRDVLLSETSVMSGSGSGNYNTVYSHSGSSGFTYDAAYNPTQFSSFAPGGDATLPLSVNSDNQINTSSFTFDGAGDPTSYLGYTMGFDPEARLVSIPVQIYGWTTPFTAAYDGDGLRGVKTATLPGTGIQQTTYFLYDGATSIVEETWDGTNATFAALNGWTADGWRARDVPSEGHATDFLYDPQGSVIQRQTDLASSTYLAASEQDTFEAYGMLRSAVHLSNTPNGNTVGLPHDPAGFGAQYGYYTDRETGLVAMTSRYYDPAKGRFINRDPSDYASGANLYAFCGGNPVNRIDPEGTDWRANCPGAADFLTGLYGALNPVTACSGIKAGVKYLCSGHVNGAALSGAFVSQLNPFDPKISPYEEGTRYMSDVLMLTAGAGIASKALGIIKAATAVATVGETAGAAATKLGDLSGKTLSSVEKTLSDSGFTEKPLAEGSQSPYRTFTHPDGSKVSLDTNNNVAKVNGPRQWTADGSKKFSPRIEPHNQPYIDDTPGR